MTIRTTLLINRVPAFAGFMAALLLGYGAHELPKQAGFSFPHRAAIAQPSVA